MVELIRAEIPSHPDQPSVPDYVPLFRLDAHAPDAVPPPRSLG
ncbi:hypothetical protein BTZ20_4259 [Rhodococcus sp. MTM3W5.2]|nr:hypothetical protein BTZ20_4259 [Rhodococcus sp. MTM3W5.2]